MTNGAVYKDYGEEKDVREMRVRLLKGVKYTWRRSVAPVHTERSTSHTHIHTDTHTHTDTHKHRHTHTRVIFKELTLERQTSTGRH